MRTFHRLFIFAILLLLLNLATAKAEEAPAPAPAAPAETMDAAAMAKMQTLMSPNHNHVMLEPLAGMWKYTGKFWMSPEAAPQEMTGTAVNELVYGGRFLKQEFEGPWMGQDFSGLGFTGYDNVKEEYVSVWLDSMGTGIMSAAGTYDSASKTFRLSGANSCPMTGEKNRQGRSTWTVVDNDHNVYTSFGVGPDGRDFKMMEIFYTRAAA